ncbi:MAG: type II toxin-antitoxin system RelE/ParE family toxin [Bacteroidetes bacterium]|nr:type II toxin-antitoxin system RelE/ParE family toxin [Bacteroidota bacterium]
MKTERKIIFYKHYFLEFYLNQKLKVQEKIEYTFKIIRTVDKVPKKVLDHITGTDGIYEIRVAVGNDIFRIFCCFDKGNLVVLFNGFQKKTQKTPKQDLEIAEKLKKEYFESKNKK